MQLQLSKIINPLSWVSQNQHLLAPEHPTPANHSAPIARHLQHVHDALRSNFSIRNMSSRQDIEREFGPDVTLILSHFFSERIFICEKDPTLPPNAMQTYITRMNLNSQTYCLRLRDAYFFGSTGIAIENFSPNPEEQQPAIFIDGASVKEFYDVFMLALFNEAESVNSCSAAIHNCTEACRVNLRGWSAMALMMISPHLEKAMSFLLMEMDGNQKVTGAAMTIYSVFNRYDTVPGRNFLKDKGCLEMQEALCIYAYLTSPNASITNTYLLLKGISEAYKERTKRFKLMYPNPVSTHLQAEGQQCEDAERRVQKLLNKLCPLEL